MNREIDAILKNVDLGGYDPREGWTGQRLNEIAIAIWQERKAGVKDSPRQQELLRKLRVLIPTTKQSERQVFEQAISASYAPDLQKAYVELTGEINAGQEESERARELHLRIEQLQLLVSSYSLNSESWQLNDSYRRLVVKLAADYARKVDEGASPEEAEPIKERARRNFERIEGNNKGEFEIFLRGDGAAS